jgi:OOP family OmpA-OmpF porin
LKFRPSHNLFAAGAYALAALISVAAAAWAASVIESRSSSAVRSALLGSGYLWAEVQADGLQVIITGTAPSEAQRFRALSAAGEVVDPERVIDGMGVDDPDSFKSPDFLVEMLRNSDGISLIGLVPTQTDRAELIADLEALSDGTSVTDLLDTADHPIPPTWNAALAFGQTALEALPRAKISVSAQRVSITAISDSPKQKAELEARFRSDAPSGVELVLDISAPRPVIAPFTLRFLIDDGGARFDACSADTDAARSAIIAAATAAGASGTLACTIGLGVPSPAWSEAVTLAIKALNELAEGSVTFQDADIALVAGPTVEQALFDRVVGELESGLPDVFKLNAVLAPKSEGREQGIPEFSGALSADGKVVLRGRINDDLSRTAAENVARVAFGGEAVTGAMRVDDTLPGSWPVRVLAGIQALALLDEGSVSVLPDVVRVTGVTGSLQTKDNVTRLLSSQLGGTEGIEIVVRYDAALDPLQGLPTPEECVASLNAILAASKIAFDPGKATIAPEARGTLDRLAAAMKDCDGVPMEVGGHTDSQGREEMNLELSQARAEAVIAALMDLRVLVGAMTAVGYGETVPIADNETEVGREANRRIEIRLLTPVAGTTAPAGPSETAGAAEATGASETTAVTVETPDDGTIKPKKRPDR